MDAAFYRHSWLEKINKTIAMITASAAYQRYIEQKRRRGLLKAYAEFSFYRWANKHGKVVKSRDCVTCGVALTTRAPLKMCRPCGRNAIISAYRSGLSTVQIALKFSVCEATVLKYLREKPRPGKKAPVVAERVPVMAAAYPL